MRPLAPAVLAALLLPAAAHADFADHWAAVDDVGEAKSPRRGASRILVLPLLVQDRPTTLDVAALHSFFEAGGDQGFSAYFGNQSLGTYRVAAEVLDPVVYETCPLPAAAFPDCRIERGDLAALAPALELLRDAFRRADEAGLDATRYDENGAAGAPDGIVDGAIVVTNLEFDGITLPIYHLNTGDDLAGGAGGSFLIDGVAVPLVAIAPDRFVAVHEFGHVLGLTDLYDETGGSWGVEWSAMGDWPVADAIPGLDAASRVALGWAHVHTVRGTERIVLPPVESSGQVVALGAGAERLLVENRGPGRWDRAMGARGLAVYHVDWNAGPDGRPGSFLSRLLACVECDPWHPFVRNLQADGLAELQEGTGFYDDDDLFRDGDALAPDPSGLPFGADHRVLSSNRYDGAETGIEIRDIAVDDATGVVSFTAVAPEDVDACVGVSCPAGEACLDGGCWPGEGGGGAGGSGGGGGDGGSGGTAGAGGSGGAAGEGSAGSSDGGGCTAAGGSTPVLAVVAAALALVRRRRRSLPVPRSPW